MYDDKIVSSVTDDDFNGIKSEIQSIVDSKFYDFLEDRYIVFDWLTLNISLAYLGVDGGDFTDLKKTNLRDEIIGKLDDDPYGQSIDAKRLAKELRELASEIDSYYEA